MREREREREKKKKMREYYIILLRCDLCYNVSSINRNIKDIYTINLDKNMTTILVKFF
jgi:hypothetical protein